MELVDDGHSPRPRETTDVRGGARLGSPDAPRAATPGEPGGPPLVGRCGGWTGRVMEPMDPVGDLAGETSVLHWRQCGAVLGHAALCRAVPELAQPG